MERSVKKDKILKAIPDFMQEQEKETNKIPLGLEKIASKV